MKKFFKRIGIIMLLLCFTGCTARLVDFTIISTKNIDLSRSGNFQRAKTRVEGKDTAMIIIFIPTGVPNIKEAIDRAIESVPGAVALVDGVLTQESFWFIFGMSSYVVEGTPLIDATIAVSELQSQFMIAKLDRKGNVKEFRYVSAEKFQAVKEKYILKHKQTEL